MRAPWGGTKPTITCMTGTKSGFRREKTYGGSLAENAIQAICRDLLCNSEVQTQAAGYDTRMTVHDELVLTTDREDANAEEVTKLMISNLPHYARKNKWPIDATTWEGPRFKKD